MLVKNWMSKQVITIDENDSMNEAINMIEIMARAEMITAQNLSRMMVKTADVAICPDTKDVYWSDFSRIDELIFNRIPSEDFICKYFFCCRININDFNNLFASPCSFILNP